MIEYRFPDRRTEVHDGDMVYVEEEITVRCPACGLLTSAVSTGTDVIMYRHGDTIESICTIRAEVAPSFQDRIFFPFDEPSQEA